MAKKNTTEEPVINETPIDDEDFFDDEPIIVEMTDEDGNVYHYAEELVIPIGDDNFAILVELHEHADGEECDCEEGDVVIAKIVIDENGEEEYVEPTDEEFDKVNEVYEQIMYEAEEDE